MTAALSDFPAINRSASATTKTPILRRSCALRIGCLAGVAKIARMSRQSPIAITDLSIGLVFGADVNPEVVKLGHFWLRSSGIKQMYRFAPKDAQDRPVRAMDCDALANGNDGILSADKNQSTASHRH